MKFPSLRWIAIGVAGVLLLVAMSMASDRRPHAEARSTANDAGAANPAVIAPGQVGASRQAQATAKHEGAVDKKRSAENDPRVKQCMSDFEVAFRGRIDELALSDEVSAQLVAALLVRDDFTSQEGYRESMKRRTLRLAAIAQRAPDDPLIAWVHASRCHSDYQCDERAALEKLLRLQPDNMAVWLWALERTAQDGDDAQAEMFLQKAAKAPHADWFWGEQSLAIVDTMGSLRVPSCEAIPDLLGDVVGSSHPASVDDMVVIFTSAMSTPMTPLGVGVLGRLCPNRGAIPIARLRTCRTVFSRLAEGDELSSRFVGTGRMLAWADSPAERAKWREQLRNLHWMQQEAGKLMRPAYGRMQLEQGEVPTLIALLEEHGRWPAPAGWLPADPAQRSRFDAP